MIKNMKGDKIMVTKNGCEGLIFLLNDKCSSSKDSKHNYLILGINEDHNNVGLVQCMSITSMHNKEITTEVPIVLSNGMVSYIVPYNIHSYSMDELDLHEYKGCITNTPYISKYEFMQLIIDLYADTLDFGLTNHRDIMRRYRKYCDSFWKNNEGITEFRDYKDTSVHPKETVKKEVQKKEIIEEEIKADPPKSAKRKNKKRKSNSSKRHSKRCKQEAIRKQEKIEQKEFENRVKIVTGIYESDVMEKKETVVDVPSVEIKNEEVNKQVIPYCESFLHTPTISDEELKLLKDIHPNLPVNKISDECISIFLKAYYLLPFCEFKKSVGTRRWQNVGKYTAFHHLAKREAIKRNITDVPLDRFTGLLPNNIINKPCSEWKDADLQMYLSVTSNHKHDPDFLCLFTGNSSINSVTQITYRVKKEAVSRGLLKVD